MDSIKHLSELNLWYIPIIVACVLLVAGFLNGFFRGWKSSLYFMIWNLVGFYVALLVLDAIYDSVLKDMAKNWFTAIENSLGATAFDDFFTLFHGWLVLMMVLLVLSFWNFIAWIVHFFFKKRFQKHLKENKAAGKSNAGSRLIGGFFGIVAVIPTTASAMASATAISSNEELNENVDSFVNAMTFGKVTEVSGDWDAMYGLALSATSAQDLAQIVIGNIDKDIAKSMIDNGLVKNAPSIVRMLNNEKSAKIAKDVIEYQINEKLIDANGNKIPVQDTFTTADVDALFKDANGNEINHELIGIFSGLTTSGKANFHAIIKTQPDNKAQINLEEMLVNPNYKPQ